MNWIFIVWIAGFAFASGIFGLVLLSVYFEIKQNYEYLKKPNNNPAKIILNYLWICCIPFLNVIFGLILLFKHDDISKQTCKVIEQRGIIAKKAVAE